MIENGNTMAAMWSYGRRLTGLSSGSEAFSYSYNADGIRTTKTVNGVKHTYALSGTTILNEEWTENGVQHLLMYVYDANGSPTGMVYRNSTMSIGVFEEYLFVKNIQGDILHVYNSAGKKLVSYVYDAWGNIISTTYSNGGGTSAARFNPFTYRGYYRDSETGMYYLNSRYYNPKMGRFISADNRVSGVGGNVIGYNVFAYCMNNPINMSDSSGHWPQWIKNATNWVNNNIIQPAANFFSTSTNTIAGSFQDGIFRGSGSLTGGYSEFNWRLDDKIKSSGAQDGWIGGFGKASVGNANGKIGIGNDNFSASLKGVADGLVATAQAGLHYKDGFGIGAKAKASVLSGRTTAEFNIFGWQVELGASADVLSIGAEATIGIFPTEDGGKQFDARAGVSPGIFGLGFVFRVKTPG